MQQAKWIFLRKEHAVSVELAVKEAANALVVAVRRGRLSIEQARRAFKALTLLTITIDFHPQGDLLPESFEAAAATVLTVYDALYIVLARRLGARLVTRDRRQYEAARRLGVEAVLAL